MVAPLLTYSLGLVSAVKYTPHVVGYVLMGKCDTVSVSAFWFFKYCLVKLLTSDWFNIHYSAAINKI